MKMQYTEEQIARANQTDLVSFLNAQGEQLVKSGREYRWKKHDSVTVSGNRWYRHSQGRGGYPVDFVMEFYNATFPEAVKMLTGKEGEGRNSACPAPSPDFRLPEKEENNDRIIRYLTENRGIEKNLVEKYHGVTAEGLVESALDKVKLIEDMGYDSLVISIKSSDVMMCVKAHELITSQTDHPLHVGITEAGTIISGNIKSAIGLGLILHQGIGDTIRVSLTGDPLEEIKSAKLILKTLGLRQGGVEVVSCPTCGRTQINLIQLANQVENMVADIPLDIKVAVMGCVVNGPGEAKEADIGIAGGIGEGLIIKHGEVFKKVPESELLEALRYELLHWNE